MILTILFLYICKMKNVKVSDVKTVSKNGHATLVSKAETLESQKIAKTGNWWWLRKKLHGGGRHIKILLSRFSPYSWSYESQFCIPCLNYAIHVSLRSLFSTLDSAVLVRLCVLWLLYEYHGLSIKMFANRAEAHVPYWNIAILIANYHMFYRGNN